MKLGRKGVLIGAAAAIAVLLGAAVLLHSPALQDQMRHFHGGPGSPSGGPGASLIGGSGGNPAANAQALEGVAAIGRRWDEAAFAETVALYTAVHRGVEWPGVLAPETIRYGTDAKQTFDLYRPEQGFSEPGPVFLFLHGNGLGNSDRFAPGSDGLIYGHLGKLAATAGGIGVSMNFRNSGHPSGDGASATLRSGAEDLRLVIKWIVEHISPYGGDPGTIVLIANSEGATTAAAYLFNEALQMPSDPGVAAAILSSGRFGALTPEIAELVDDYAGARVPLALWSGEFDTPEITNGIAALHEQLCRKYDDCPTLEQLSGHNHVSHVMSLGTADTSAMNSLIRFYHTLR